MSLERFCNGCGRQHGSTEWYYRNRVNSRVVMQSSISPPSTTNHVVMAHIPVLEQVNQLERKRNSRVRPAAKKFPS
jgi:hypothetical protein